MSTHEAFMQRAIDISREALTKPGCNPFGAVVVRDGVIVGEGLNHAGAHFDPTSHGEVEAIRDACRRLECLELKDCDLYTSCEPCALCVATMSIVGMRKLYYAASLDQSGAALASALRPAIDVAKVRSEAGRAAHDRDMPAEQIGAEAALEILTAWADTKQASA